MKALLEYLTKNIANQPDKIKIKSDEENGTINLSLVTDPEDTGKIIGRKGKTIKAIRSLLYLKALLANKRVNLRLVETGEATGQDKKSAEVKPDVSSNKETP